MQLRMSIPQDEIKLQHIANIKCPKCKPGNIHLYDKVAQCDHYARGCDFKIWRTLNGVFLEEKEMKNLLEKGKTSELKGVKTKEGQIVNVPLVFENFKVNVG